MKDDYAEWNDENDFYDDGVASKIKLSKLIFEFVRNSKYNIEFFFKKLCIKKQEYKRLQHEAKMYHGMMCCIHMEVNPEYVDAKDTQGNVLIRFEKSIDCIVNIDVKKMLKAGGYTFDESIKFKMTIDE